MRTHDDMNFKGFILFIYLFLIKAYFILKWKLFIITAVLLEELSAGIA